MIQLFVNNNADGWDNKWVNTTFTNKKPVSIDEAMKYLIRKSKKGKRISDLAGSWIISDDEADRIKESAEKVWETWKPIMFSLSYFSLKTYYRS